ncbi:Site-specific recombinase XerD [Flavobacterium gillisiae]|uniref:Site-specific recombinase XerD n=1 Tax=Flavobacterium gillisiae TaxID=150146 RepID=A0A1H4FCH3_9FLAO|nr:tyrosine-type recombinase/integrase [Flavobacterium gillisiae]SEA95019.1 Site-specific recombinase XerD [Flavobacterium gillisiae]
MSKISLLLQTVHARVHDLPMKPHFSQPTIFTGGVDVRQWNKLSKKEQEIALSKSWYLYYSCRNPKTGFLVRQPNIKNGVNKLKTAAERFNYLEKLKIDLVYLLEKGFNPYTENEDLEAKIFGKSTNEQSEPIRSTISIEESIPKKENDVAETQENILCIREAFEFGLKLKKSSIGKTSYSGLQGRIKRFLTWMDEDNGASANSISTLSKKSIINYLNFVLINSSARNRNNTKADLSSLIQTLVDNELMKENFVSSINTLKSAPERNKTYSVTQETDILSYLEANDKILLLFIQFITYNFLRPVEVCRLRISDLDLEGKKLFVRAKNKAVKVKIIPQKLIDLLPDLCNARPDHFLFTPTEIGGEWETEENNRRDYFSKRFKEVKDHFNLDKNYGLYSFRHTSITNLYKEFSRTLTPYETKSRLMQITGHQTMEALEKYLRDIDAALPEDYSHLLN